MSKGFIYDKDKCVNCKACSAACILENRWSVSGRQVLTYNSDVLPLIPLIHLSLACNHCESAVCMTGCPSSAYSRDLITGAVVLDESKCTGCKYCQWNCPYDAPKFDPKEGTIVKCNLCYTEIKTGYMPACTRACPTGALSFGELPESLNGNRFSWFPEKGLQPAIEFTNLNSKLVQIVPERNEYKAITVPDKERKNISPEISLIIFSFLSTLLVSLMASSFITGTYPGVVLYSSALILTASASLFHLGRKNRFWRAVFNVKKSPLSREIVSFLVFSILSIITLLLLQPYLFIATSIAGMLFLVLIDSVYIFSDKSRSVMFHSGQTFISSLTIISFFSGAVFPFIFMGIINIALSFPELRKQQKSYLFTMRFFRIVFLILPGCTLVLHTSIPDYSVIFIFLLGELFDRILFYIDFNPMNIRNLMLEQLKSDKDEKKRG